MPLRSEPSAGEGVRGMLPPDEPYLWGCLSLRGSEKSPRGQRRPEKLDKSGRPQARGMSFVPQVLAFAG
jgi:hypothetical protein